MQEVENIANEKQKIIAKIPITQEEINQIKKIYKLDFPCPHCQEKINDDHFSKDQRVFQLIDERLREITEKHLSIQKNIIRQELLEEIEKNRTYESFQEVQKIKQDREEKGKEVTKLEKEVARLNSSEHVEGLSRVKQLKEELEKLREQNQILQHLSKKSGQEKGKEFEE